VPSIRFSFVWCLISLDKFFDCYPVKIRRLRALVDKSAQNVSGNPDVCREGCDAFPVLGSVCVEPFSLRFGVHFASFLIVMLFHRRWGKISAVPAVSYDWFATSRAVYYWRIRFLTHSTSPFFGLLQYILILLVCQVLSFCLLLFFLPADVPTLCSRSHSSAGI